MRGRKQAEDRQERNGSKKKTGTRMMILRTNAFEIDAMAGGSSQWYHGVAHHYANVASIQNSVIQLIR